MSKNQQASDFIFEVFSIQSEINGEFDLQNMFLELNVYEDLFTPFMSANIAISDAINIPMNLPIIGEENVSIQFKTAGMQETSNYFFKTFSITGRKHIKPSQQVYVIECISETALHNEQHKISKSYRNRTGSEIIRDIFKTLDYHDIFDIDIEDTVNTLDCVIPNWKPIDAINWLSRQSIGEQGQSDFIYFENSGAANENTMNFKSLRSLITADVDPTAEQTRLVLDIAGNKETRNKPNRVLGWYFDNNFSSIKNVRNGMYGSRVTTFDPVRKNIETFDYDYFKTWEPSEHLEDNPYVEDLVNGGISTTKSSENFGDFPEANCSVIPKHKQLFTGSDKDNNVENWLQQRKSVFQQLNNIRLMVVVTGNSTYRAGQVVYLDLPSTEAKTNSQFPKLDKHFSGKFLITSIRHKIQRDKYEMILELTKDSLQHPVAHTARVHI